MVNEESLILLLLVASLAHAAPYQDEELDQLWSSVSNQNNPSREDYRLIDNYLRSGARPYLDPLRESARKDSGFANRLSRILNFQLLGSEGEVPIFEKHALNLRQGTETRCILLYSSCNSPYPEKARRMIAKLQKCGYSGYVLLRIGGFPNIRNGGLKLCHIPYAFKVAFIREAKLLGFSEVLWLDTSLQPLQDLESIFSEIGKRGHYLTCTGTMDDNFPAFDFPETAKALKIKRENYKQIPHITSSILGFDMGNSRATVLLNRWYNETERTVVNIAWFPEEMALSVAAWRLECKPVCPIGLILGESTEYYFQSPDRPKLQFFVDNVR